MTQPKPNNTAPQPFNDYYRSINSLCHLSLLNTNDIEPIFNIFHSDVQLCDSLGPLPVPYTLDDAHRYVMYCHHQYDTNTIVQWCIRDNNTKQLIGCIGINDIDDKCATGSIGFWLDQQYRGKGIMHDSISCVLNLAYNELELHTINAYIHCNNTVSEQIIQRQYFVYADTIYNKYDKHMSHGGIQSMDVRHYELTHNRWLYHKQRSMDIATFYRSVDQHSYLSMYRLSDADRLCMLVNTDPSISDNLLRWNLPYTIQSAYQHIINVTQLNHKVDSLDVATKYVIRDKKNNQLLGQLSINTLDDTNYVFGYWLCAEYRGLDIMYNTMKIGLDIVFNNMRLPYIDAYTWFGNISSERVLQKHWFLLIDTHIDQYTKLKADGVQYVLSSKQFRLTYQQYKQKYKLEQWNYSLNEYAYLSLIQPTDIKQIHRILCNDSQLLESLLLPPIPYTHHDAQQWVTSVQSHYQSIKSVNECQHYCIRDIHTHVMIGTIGVDCSKNDNSAQIGYWLDKQYRGKHIMSDAVKIILNIAFTQLNYHTVYAMTFVGNTASINVIQSNQFTLRHTHKDKHKKTMADGSVWILSENEWILTKETWHNACQKQTMYNNNKLKQLVLVKHELNTQSYMSLIQPDDVSTIHKHISNDCTILDSMCMPTPFTQSDAQSIMTSAIQQYLMTRDNIYTTWCLRDNHSRQLIGCIWLNKIVLNQSCYIAYWLAQPYRKQHIMTDAVGVLLNIAFTMLNVDSVQAEIFLNNSASEQLIKSFHFIHRRTYMDRFKKPMSDGSIQSMSENRWILTKHIWLQKQSDCSIADQLEQNKLDSMKQFKLDVNEHCYLSLLQLDDAATIYNAMINDSVLRDGMAESNVPKSMDHAVSTLESVVQHYMNINNNEYTEFALRDVSTYQLIGCIWIRGIVYDELCNHGKLGYWLDQQYRNRGLMNQAATVVIHHAFTTLKLDELSAVYFIGNTASERVLRKLHFTYTTHLYNRWMKTYTNGTRLLSGGVEYKLSRDVYLNRQQHRYNCSTYMRSINNHIVLSMYTFNDIEPLTYIMNHEHDIPDNQLHSIQPYTSKDAYRQIRTCIELNHSAPSIDHCYKYCLRDTGTNHIIGSIGLSCLHNKHYVLAYWLIAQYRGNGIMYHTLHIFLSIVFHQLKLIELVTYTFESNQSSETLLIHHGFQYIKLIRNKQKKLMSDGTHRQLNSKQWRLSSQMYHKLYAIYQYRHVINQHAYLSYLQYSDLSHMADVLNNHTDTQHHISTVTIKQQDATSWMNQLIHEYRDHNTTCTQYGIRSSDTNRFIGYIGLVNGSDDTIELSYWCGTQHQQIMSNAISIVLDIGLMKLCYNVVNVNVHPDNTSSQHILGTHEFQCVTDRTIEDKQDAIQYKLTKQHYNLMQQIHQFHLPINTHAYLSHMLYSDVDERAELISTDQLIMDNSRYQQPYTLHDCVSYYNTLVSQYQTNTCTNYIIRCSDTHRFIGDIGLDKHFSDRLDLHYRINSRYSNKQIISDAIRIVLDIGFHRLGLDEIGAISMVHNTISHHILYKYGFQLIDNYDDSHFNYVTRIGVKRLHFILTRNRYRTLINAQKLHIPINHSSYLSYMRYSDMKDRVRIISTDTNIIHNTWFPQPYTMSDAIQYYNTLVEQYESNVCTQYCIRDSATNQYIGYIGLDKFCDTHYELGYHIDTTYSNQHIMTDVICIVLNIAFNELLLDSLYATVLEYNQTSQHLLQKFHFVQTHIDDGTIIHAVYPDVKRIHFVLSKTKYMELQTT